MDRISDERLAELLKDAEQCVSASIANWQYKNDTVKFVDMHSILTELQRHRAEARQAPVFEESGEHGVFTPITITNSTSAPLPAGTVTDALLRDLEEISSAVFGDLGSDPDVYADHDRLSALSGKMRRAIATIEAAFAARPAEPVAMKQAAEFLLDRLEDLERGWDDEEAFREYNGHVAPAAARLRSALVSTPAPGLVEARDALGETLDKDFAFWSSNNVPDSIRSKIWSVYKALSSITETGGAKE